MTRITSVWRSGTECIGAVHLDSQQELQPLLGSDEQRMPRRLLWTLTPADRDGGTSFAWNSCSDLLAVVGAQVCRSVGNWLQTQPAGLPHASCAAQRSLQVCNRCGNVLADLPFPLEDFLLRHGPGCAARALAWDADGTQLAVLPCAQASVVLWSQDCSELIELTPGEKVRSHPSNIPVQQAHASFSANLDNC